MKTRSNKYWRNRAKERMNYYHRNSDKTIQTITKAYDNAVKDIEEDVKSIFDKFARDGELSSEEAKKILNEKVSSKELDEIRGIAYTIEDKEIKKQLMNRLNAQAYKARITRLEALKEKAYIECKKISNVEIQASTNQYIDTVNEAYYRNIFDIHKGLGIGFDFAAIPTKTIEQILKNPWSGKHFSSRVWKNTDILAEKLTEIITSGLMSGKSYCQMAKELEEYTEYGKYAAMRLIRTESTYMANMAEIESYKECGIEKYIYVATLDLRTSEMCQELDRKVFKVEDAELGKNLPPMHPNCRSTTRSYISEEELKKIKRRARDPKTGKTYLVPGDMEYKEWYQKYVVNKHGQDQAKAMKKKIINKSSDRRQYEKYKDILGKEIPDSFDKLQELKYNNGKEWEKLKNKIKIKSSGYSTNNRKNLKPTVSNINWSEHLKVSTENSSKLNEIHTNLNEFMHKNNREKVYLLDKNLNKIIYQLEGSKKDEVTFDKEIIKLLKDSEENSIILSHNHPSKTTFSRYDIEKIVKYKSIGALTLECIDGTKYILDRGNLKSSFIKDFGFMSKYQKTYDNIATKYPELNDEVKIYNVWDQFLNEITGEIAKEYDMIYKKVEGLNERKIK